MGDWDEYQEEGFSRLALYREESSRPDRYHFAFLADVDGSRDMNVNGSVTAVNFKYVFKERGGEAASYIRVQRLNMLAEDTAQAEVVTGFFSLAALSAGLLFQVLNSRGKVMQHFATDVEPLKSTADISALAGFDIGGVSQSVAGGASAYHVRWTLAKAGQPLLLYPGEAFSATVQDDLSALTKFRIMVQGVEMDAGVSDFLQSKWVAGR